MTTLDTPIRPEYELALEPFTAVPLSRPLPFHRRLWQQGWVRKAVILLALAVLWEILARIQDNDLLLPTFLATARAFG
ncbi:ABC transporter permease, partial [Cupriavidus sp. KB_39]